jgi:hypothetical protein
MHLTGHTVKTLMLRRICQAPMFWHKVLQQYLSANTFNRITRLSIRVFTVVWLLPTPQAHTGQTPVCDPRHQHTHPPPLESSTSVGACAAAPLEAEGPLPRVGLTAGVAEGV